MIVTLSIDGVFVPSDVSVTFMCGDANAGLDAAGCPALTTVTTDGAGQSRTGVVTDRAGNTASTLVGNINIDTVAPIIVGARTPLPNANGWNNTDVTVSFTCADALSGLDAAGCPAVAVVTTEGAAQSRTGAVADRAGNTASIVVSGISVDKTAPTFSNVMNLVVDATMPIGAVVPYAVPTVTDGLTGPIVPLCAPASGSTFPVGTSSVHCDAEDMAGNMAQASFTVTVLSPAQQLDNLLAVADGVGPGGSFAASIQAAARALARGQNRVAASNLQALIKKIEAQSGKSITAAQAALYEHDRACATLASEWRIEAVTRVWQRANAGAAA